MTKNLPDNALSQYANVSALHPPRKHDYTNLQLWIWSGDEKLNPTFLNSYEQQPYVDDDIVDLISISGREFDPFTTFVAEKLFEKLVEKLYGPVKVCPL